MPAAMATMLALLPLAAQGAPAVERLVAGVPAKPWLFEEERVARSALRPDLCVTAAAAGGSLELRACAGGERQRVMGRSSLRLAGRCASAEVGAEAAAPCAEASEDFALPAGGQGPLSVVRGGAKLCLTPRGLEDGAPVELRRCDGGVSQDFLLPRAAPSSDGRGAFLGVNLGGWLILEAWMLPGEMESQDLIDEHSFIASHGGPEDARAKARMQQHWETFLRPEHLDRLRRLGITHVRIPIGYWLFDAVHDPRDGFVSGGEPFLRRAVGWLKARGMRAVLDLHALPGGQARWQSFTGRVTGEEHFFLNDAEFNRGKQAVQELAKLVLRYEAEPSTAGVVVGVELLNEPSHAHVERTKEFYSEMVPVVRRSLPADRYFIMLSFMDSPHTESMDWVAAQVLADPGNWSGVVHDPHLYHLFGDNHAPWSEEQDFCKACCRDPHILRPLEAVGVPTIVGEYSTATGYLGWHEGDFLERNLQNYVSLWSTATSVVGSFMWNYRILVDPAQPSKYVEWSLLDMVDLGYIRPDFAYALDTSVLCPAMREDLARCPDFTNATVKYNTRCAWRTPAPGGLRRRLAPAPAEMLV